MGPWRQEIELDSSPASGFSEFSASGLAGQVLGWCLLKKSLVGELAGSSLGGHFTQKIYRVGKSRFTFVSA